MIGIKDRNLPRLTELRVRTIYEIIKKIETAGYGSGSAYFGIGESAASQVSRRFGMELEKDKKLNGRMKDICNRMGIV